jgi:hypothetical protein
MAIGPSLTLQIAKKEKVVAEFREVCGPRDAVLAKQDRQSSSFTGPGGIVTFELLNIVGDLLFTDWIRSTTAGLEMAKTA